MKDEKKTKAQLIEELKSLRKKAGIISDDRETQVKNIDSGENLRDILNVMDDMVFVLDKDNRFISTYSPRGKLFISPEQFIGKTHSQIMPAHVDKMFAKAIPDVKKGNSIGYEYSLKMPDGLRWYSIKLSPLFSENIYNGLVAVSRDITKQKNVEIALKESEDRLSKIRLAANDGMWDWNLQTDEVYFDPRYYEMAGYKKDEFPHKLDEFKNRVHPDDIQMVMDATQKHLEGKKERFEVEFRFKKKEGNWLWITGKGIIVERDDEDQPLRFVGTHTDITDRKIAEEKLKEREEHLNTFFDNSPVGMAIWDIEFRYVYINEILQKINGPSKEEHIGKTIHQVLPKAAHLMAPLFKNIIKTGKPVYNLELSGEVPSTPGRETHYLVSYFPLTVADGNPRFIGGVVVDITSQKDTEKALRKSSIIIDSTSDAVISTNIEGIITFWNKGAERIYGFQSSEVIGKPIGLIYKDEDLPVLTNLITDLLDGKEIPSVEVTCINKQKEDVEILLSLTTIKDKNGRIEELVGITKDITERKQSEKTLIESENRYKLLVENQSDLIVKVDLEGHFLYVSPSYCRLFGKTEDQLLHKKFLPLVHKEDQDKTELAMQDLFRPPYTCYIEQRAKTKDGWRWLSWRDTALLNDDNEVYGIIGLGQDITERKQAEDSLKKSELEFRGIFEQSPLAIQIYDKEGKLIDVNKQTMELFGVNDKKHILGYEFWDDPNLSSDKADALRNLQPVFISTTLDFDTIRKLNLYPTNHNGIKYLDMYVIPLRQKKEITGYLVQIVDMTTREKDRKKLEVINEALENSLNGFDIVNVDGVFTYVNKAYVKMWGYDNADEIIGTSPVNHCLDPKIPEKVIRTLKESGRCEIEFLAKRKDGSTFDVLMYARIAYDVHGKEIYPTTSIDITDRKQAEKEKITVEAQVRHQQKLESVGTLAGGVAHEINNPLNGIMNYAQLIDDELGEGNTLKKYSSEIIRESERISDIVRNLLTFSRDDKESHSPARIDDIIESTVSLVNIVFKKDQITLNIDIPQNLPSIKCRSQQIRQVIMNLMTNARDSLNQKYSGYDENKVINISVSQFADENRRWFRVMVEDKGVGINEDIQGKIFDPFFTSKDRAIGTGLGLSISYGLVKDHNGKLHFETEVGEFTRFYLDLPIDNGWTI
ncbi:MAG: PAS domain S-box protein [Calditrichaeota bacterium]|nr:MAG: PAS domain S-box protein [Calditrichota bacterium]MBL1206830.1 PAS domain S-box protein [Calditrichota bacterium]NOG46657.1 PAS domain S-box protein [Calditrichota bacterium]